MLAVAPDVLEAAAPEALVPVALLVLRLEAAEAFDACENPTCGMVSHQSQTVIDHFSDHYAQRRTFMFDIKS